MPTLAMQAKELWEEDAANEEDKVVIFLNLLNRRIYEAKDILIERFEHICSQNPASAKFMYENGTMEGYIPEEGIRSALKHGTLAIGNERILEWVAISFSRGSSRPRD